MNQDILIRSLKRQLLIERVLMGVVAVILLSWCVCSHFSQSKAFILVDGKPVVCVPSEEDAQDVLRRIKSGAGCDSAEIEFKQDVVVARAPRDAHPISRHRALDAMRNVVSPVVPKWAVIVNGKPVVAVSSRTDAGEVLDMAKLRFGKLVKNLCEEPQFKEKVTVDLAAVSPSICRKTPQEAVDYLFSQAAPVTEETQYTVKQGDLAGEIAARHGMKLAELWALNTGINLHRLQIGDKVRVKRSVAPKSKLTVVVRDQSERTESVPPPVQRVSSASMFAGKTVQLSPGTPGRRKVKAATIYENGCKVGSDILEEQIIRQPTPRRIAEGIKPRPR